MFRKILIANRGEIACRILRTAKRLGIETVAVYSDADAAAAHVAEADGALRIGPAPAAESYLDGAAIAAAARQSGAQAVHPGYGFLAENADFAEACIGAGLVFVGPPPAAIRTLGSKAAAKELMAAAGVPLVPGYHGAAQDPETLAQAAAGAGYPVLIKASAGGGGKGMRVVERARDFAAALESARREAAAAFGDDRMIVEKFIERPRHVEVQVFADGHGNAVHLFERDCSIQRRHQKVLEEAPAPGLAAGLREEMTAAALAATRASGYLGAGTVEFLCAGEAFYFMEMNTRLQVEHPVTEMILGLDLVEWQLRVAAGERLPLGQDALVPRGHAIESRIYAEDPANGFLPSTGPLLHLRFPAPGRHVRVESGVRQGDEITLHYDPMIAKLIVWDRDRPGALERLRTALGAVEIFGPAHNVAFLSALAGHAAFAAGALETGFIARHLEDLLPAARPAPDEALALAALAEVLERRARAAALARASPDPHSPWFLSNGWRLHAGAAGRLAFRDGAQRVEVGVAEQSPDLLLELPGGRCVARGEMAAGGALGAELDGRPLRATVLRRGAELVVLTGGATHRLLLDDPLQARGEDEAGVGRMTAPMPGKVIEVHVAPGQAVRRGAPLIVLEAMKMEHSIAAPADGTVARVHFAAGDLVEEGAELIAFETESPAP